MIRTGLVGTVLVLAAASVVARHQPPQGDAPGGSGIGVHKEFMALPADQRRARFAAMTPENKASLARAHMEGWIQTNKGRLTASEIGVFEEMVAYIRPEINDQASPRQADRSLRSGRRPKPTKRASKRGR